VFSSVFLIFILPTIKPSPLPFALSFSCHSVREFCAALSLPNVCRSAPGT
jgi:hypothetical protein